MKRPAIAHLTIAYDGACPVCSRYSRYMALRRIAGKVSLDNVRDLTPEVRRTRYPGVDFEQGFVVVADGQQHHGAAALALLASLDEQDHTQRLLFGGRRRSRAWYPLLRWGRWLLLRLLRRPRLGRAGTRHDG